MFDFFGIKALKKENKELQNLLKYRIEERDYFYEENKKNLKEYSKLHTIHDNNNNEIQILKESLRLLKDFCINKGYDPTPLIGHYSKSIHSMTREELVARNNEAIERQKDKVAKYPSNAVPTATFEQMEILSKNQSELVMKKFENTLIALGCGKKT